MRMLTDRKNTIYRNSTMNDDDFSQIAKALGHPIRMQIVRLLRERETCVCGPIVDQLGMAQSTVSQHLKVLKDAGVIQGTISGRTTCFCLDHAVLQAATQVMGAIAEAQGSSCC